MKRTAIWLHLRLKCELEHARCHQRRVEPNHTFSTRSLENNGGDRSLLHRKSAAGCDLFSVAMRNSSASYRANVAAEFSIINDRQDGRFMSFAGDRHEWISTRACALCTGGSAQRNRVSPGSDGRSLLTLVNAAVNPHAITLWSRP